jgi:hypothetical protein
VIERLFAPIPDDSKAIESAHQRRVKAADRLVARAQQQLQDAKRKARRSAKAKPKETTQDDWETQNTISDW